MLSLIPRLASTKLSNSPRHLACALAVSLLALPAQAATFTVNFSAEVSEISSPLPVFFDIAPFAVGDTMTISAEFQSVVPPTPSVGTTRYENSLVSLTGSIGSYTFTEAGPSGRFNATSVRGAEYGSFAGDTISSAHSIAGDPIGGWAASSFLFSVYDSTATLLDDDAYGQELFDDALLAAIDPDDPDTFQSARLLVYFDLTSFTNGNPQRVRVTADLTAGQDTPPLAPVPLPAS
ncbi:MAG: hypothetical protein AAGF68_03840, partial [Pseudomonadota bacterium]